MSNLTILRISDITFSFTLCQKLNAKNWKNWCFPQSFTNRYLIMKNLTKFVFYIILSVLKHHRSILVNMRKPLDFEISPQNHVLWTKCVKYWICGFNREISTWKLFFQKVWMIVNIFHIYDIFSKWIFIDIELNEVVLKIVTFGWFPFQKCTVRV